jgi:CubicO group peptidase (beta-lactamase class C family)
VRRLRRIAIAVFSTALAAALLSASSAPAPPRRLDGKRLEPARIDARVRELMRAGRVPGLALSLIRGGRVAYVRAYGLRDVEKGVPLTTDTVMYGASLTKATFAYMVMQLVEEGRIDLDRPIAAYLPGPLPDDEGYAGLESDPRWARVTFRMLLDHTSGLPNLRFITPHGIDRSAKLAFAFDPGTRYSYSGEGFLLAQRVLEHGLGLDVSVEMQRRVFDRFHMTRTAMTWRESFGDNVAQGYDLDGKCVGHDRHTKVRALGSMDTTITDWSRFLAGVVRGDGLAAAARAEMIRRQVAIHSATQFPTWSERTTQVYDSIRLGYGLGWGVFETPFGHAFFKEGHDEGTANYALCVELRRACILLMSNSVRAEGIFKPLVDELMGDTRLPWRWEGYAPLGATAANESAR